MEPAPRHTFSRAERLKLRADYRRCIRSGGRAAGQYITLYLCKNDLGIIRLGAGTTRRLGNAVRRNRAKRLVREVFRLHKSELPPGVDLVALPKIPWADPTLDQLAADLITTARLALGNLQRRH